jgi:hypothetical protein
MNPFVKRRHVIIPQLKKKAAAVAVVSARQRFFWVLYF